LQQKGILQEPFVSSRVTQCYETGCAVYFYFGFLATGLRDCVRTYMEIEEAARDEIIANGGSLSHHHGVGKIRKQWVPETISNVGVDLLKGIKKVLDPNNVFVANNIIDFNDTTHNNNDDNNNTHSKQK